MEHLGTQECKSVLYDYHASGDRLHVYQTRRELGNSSKPVWFCSLSAWENALHRVCNLTAVQSYSPNLAFAYSCPL